MKNLSFGALLVVVSFLSTCSPSPVTTGATRTPQYTYEVVNIYPHDPGAFTQGLIFRDGKLLESTGQEGRSSLRSVDLESGQILRKVDLPSQYFGEGLTVMNGKIYQLTWQHQVGFIYDYQTFQKIGEFRYEGEGWGLTNDGRSLILSDGTNRIRFIDPDSFRVSRTIAVSENGKAIKRLNELEFIHGEIYANVWQEQRIATIDPQSGAVTAWIDCTDLLKRSGSANQEGVLNGIALDEASGRLFVTGKLWPKLFEIKIKK